MGYTVGSGERYLILDFLRGFALLGICLANFPEFALYTFLPAETVAAMPSAGLDRVVRFLQSIFIDGKFYTLFSLLFGVGFAIFLANAKRKNKNGLRLFYRRMTGLFLIGLFHLLCLWAGDILILYAFLGFFLPLFGRLSDRKLWIAAVVLLLTPILVDACTAFFGWNLSAPAIRTTARLHATVGITETNFPVWLVEANRYAEVLQFNVAGAFIRLQEFIDGNRAFKVMGLFLIGFYIGRNRLYAQLEDHTAVLRKIRNVGFAVGLPLSVVYAWNGMQDHALGAAGSAALYTFSVFPMSFAYLATISLYAARKKERRIFRLLAPAGRMALTNYLGQSVLGMVIFYGIGFRLGARTGLACVACIAGAVFVIQLLLSHVWLRYARFGLLEWVWRLWTYGVWLPIGKKDS
jgi:uncharacterized protein